MPSTPYFFTDPTKLSNQTVPYGPVTGNETKKYLVTGKLKFQSAADAIAVCTGYVFIQPHAGISTLVNLVLVPILADQIENNYTPVKYFVYRGLKKANILNSSGAFLAATSSSASGMVKEIWQQFNLLKTLDTGISTTVPNPAAVGWNASTNPGTDGLAGLLQANGPDFELAAIPAGTQLAKFDLNNAGFEVVLEEAFYEPDLDYLRAADHSITAATPPANALPGGLDIADMRLRENILNFMDPAAWYATFFKAGVQVVGSTVPVKGFANIRNTLLPTFLTKGRLYVDIRNENGHSLNYYRDNEGTSTDGDYGKHVQISWDGSSFIGTNYYGQFWPLLPLSPPASASADFNTLSIKFRKHYNPEPLIYADHALKLVKNSLARISSYEKFNQELDAIPAAVWSEAFQYKVPNSPGTGVTSVAFPVRLMNIRQVNPDIPLPASVISKKHFLDNVFGPADYVPDVAPGTATQWESGLGKKFIDGRNEMGIAGIFETGMGISGNDVSYFASIIDEYRPGITLGRSPVQDSKPETGGKAQAASLVEELAGTWYRDRDFELQKQELSGSTFYIMDQKPVAPPTNISGQINLVMSKAEYDAMVVPANIDTSLHAPMLAFAPFTLEADNNDVPYRKAALKVNGTDSSGVMASGNLGMQMLTFNYGVINTEAAGNVVDLASALRGILTVDEIIAAIKVVEKIYFDDGEFLMDFLYDNRVEETCARIRRHYYGLYRDDPKTSWLDPELIDSAIGIIFEHTLPLVEETPGFNFRYLSTLFFLSPSEYVTYLQLTSNADENGIKDNPSPYLKHNGKNIDFGQILYGFETIFYQPHYPPSQILSASKPDPSTYSPTYEKFGTHIVNDLAGWIANIITPVTDYFIYVQTGVSPYANEDFPPQLSFDAFYDYSAPSADLYGNADSIGIYKAVQVLDEYAPNDGKLRLSDVFTLYYKGASQLRPEIGISGNPSYALFTVAHRWKIFSLFFGFLAEDGTGGYLWVPDSPTLWANVKAPYSSSNPTGKDYDNRLFNFAELWLTTRKSFFKLATALVLNVEYPLIFVDRFNDMPNFNDPILWVNNKISEAFETKFLQYIKSLTL